MPRFVLLASIWLIAAYWTSALANAFGWYGYSMQAEGASQFALWVSAAAAVTSIVVAVLMRGSGERFTDLGFRPTIPSLPRLAPSELAMLALAVLGVLSAMVAFGGPRPRSNAATSIFADFAREPHGTLWLTLLMIAGAYREELMRAFCVTRFEQVFGRAGLVAALVVDSIVFGLGHHYQGNPAVFFTAVMGLGYAGIFLRHRRVIDAMIVHGVWNLSILCTHAVTRSGG